MDVARPVSPDPERSARPPERVRSSPHPFAGALVKLLTAALVACTLTAACRTGAAARPAAAPAVERVENYTTQSLLVYNARGEVALQRNALGWSTPGLRFDQRTSIRASLDGLAAKYGMRITDARLAGLFTYTYGFSTATATRSHYAAALAGGALAAPGDMLEVRWVAPAEAVRLISSASQKAPPSFVAMTAQILTRPDRIWGGAFHVWQEGETYRSRVTEPMYELGRTR